MRRSLRLLTALCLALSVLGAATVEQQTPAALVLLIQPVLSEAETRATYQPLADYIAAAAGRPCQIRTAPNFLAYWDIVRRNRGYDLVLDDAHFTAYRLQKQGFQLLVKAPGMLSYSLVTTRDQRVLDPMDLAGKTIASLGPPSLGLARLQALFPNPLRQPAVVEVANAAEGMQALLTARVQAAILPTPIVQEHVARGDPIALVTATEPVPQAALSAAPGVDPAIRAKIRTALLGARHHAAGREALHALGFTRFEPATSDLYAGYARVLRDYWGY